MTYSTPKPLPDIPSSPVLRRLTIDSNRHLSELIQHVVDEEGLDNSWTDAIKTALADFGEYVASAQILPGLKGTRKAQNHASAQADAVARECRRKERERQKEAKIGKSKGIDKSPEKETMEVEALNLPENMDVILKEIHALTSRVSLPAPTTTPKHLFLTAAPPSITLSEQDTDFDIVPESRACLFTAETYSLPFYNDEQGKHGQGGIVICGLDNWKHEMEASPRIVGGTFFFRNLTSITTYESLTIVLKLSIYTYMSLILEQHLLTDLHITLEYPTPPPSFLTSPLQSYPTIPSAAPPRKSRSAKSSAGIWSFLSRKTEGIIHRVAGANLGSTDDPLHRASSLDLSSVLSSPSWRTHRISEESARIDFIPAEAEHVSNISKESRAHVMEEEDRQDRERFGPFKSTLRHILHQHCILSTSPKLVFPPPPLILRLAQREEEQSRGGDASSSVGGTSISSSTSGTIAVVTPNSLPGPSSLKLTGVEKTGLGSVLGWEGRDTRGSGMAGVKSFVRHQGLTVLYAEQTKSEYEAHACGRPRLVTFRYWTRKSAMDVERDQSLGQVVERACDEAEAGERCETEGCDKPRGKHCISWTCGGVKIGATVKESKDAVCNGDGIEMWQTCTLCGKTTDRTKMDDGTYLFSFAKFLELLIWSPLLTSLAQCQHDTSPPPSSPQAGAAPISSSRFHILRHFAQNRRILTFTLASVQTDVYEVRLPKLQLISGSVPKEAKHLFETMKNREDEEDRQVLAREIGDWWQGVKTWLDKLAVFLEHEAVHALESKDLPPLPASEDEASDDESISPPARPPSRRPQMSRLISIQQSLTPPFSEAMSRKPAAPYPPVLPSSTRESRKLLKQLRTSFQNTEDTLRKQVQETPFSSLNDVRQTFRSTSRGVSRRLMAWQKKHAPGAPTEILAGHVSITEPEWWSGTCHTVPGGHVVVREGEWGSVIAFTLSSLDYQRELASLHMTSGSPSSPSSAISTLSDPHSPSPNATIRPIRSLIQNPDPDENDTTSWEELEVCTTVITRREHPREVSSLLSLRDVLRTKHSFDSSSIGSRFSKSVSRGVANFTPPAAWAQPQVKVNLEAVDGQVSQFPEAAEVIEKALVSQCPVHHHAETTVDSDKFSDAGEATPTPSNFVETHIRSGGASTFMTFDHSPETNSSGTHPVPLLAPKPKEASGPVPVPGSIGHGTPPSSSSFSSTLFSNAMRYFLNAGPPSRAPSPVPSGPHHGLLAFDAASPIDDRPHIKYEWTIGKRLKFSCTVYYAKQFDALRKRCGVDEVVIKSLERSENWTAVGGKSKSNFWKSADDRFIIKTLVNAWNVADLQVLIELAPSYFRHIDSTASKASVLAKLMGFYTIEIKNLETGSVQAKHDLLVMENLFYNQTVTKTFDLKGIQSRRVKANNDGGGRQTLFDAEWIESQQRAPLIIQPYSAHILSEAIKSDADFLAKSNIMDYSLLLGIDQERHEIACGLVDTIGSYTFAKTLEYKAKQNLNSGKGKEVTVIPPTEYHSRFVHSMDGYFMTCPDKWTKPPHFVDRTKVGDLPSVV